MIGRLYEQLQWLPLPPDDFARLCQMLGAASTPGAAARALAGNQLARLGKR